jgi:sigma-E factor negative regulatory protein RseA
VAAGFVAVAGTVVVLQRPAPAPEMSVRSAGAPTAAQVVALPAAASQPLVEAAVEAPVVVANPTMIRDARLDRYLSAHQQFAGNSAFGGSSRYLRSATVEAPSR